MKVETEDDSERETSGPGVADARAGFNGFCQGPENVWSSKTVPWPEAVDGKMLLDELANVFRKWAVLPKFGAEASALFTVHTYAYQLRDVTAYLGIESPVKRCGKSTLLAVLSALVNRPVVSSNISPPAFFRVIEEARPTLLIDEADTLLKGNDELRGILNSGYTKSTAFVVRVASQPAQNGEEAGQSSREADGEVAATASSGRPSAGLAVYSSWCPKVMAAIGHLPDTLADRCIVIRMQRKTAQEQCERLRNLSGIAERLRRRCARFVGDNAERIAAARPLIPAGLNDRAADVWEPLFAIADLAGEYWPEQARLAAAGLAAENWDNPIGSLFLDIFVLFTEEKAKRLLTRQLIEWLTRCQSHAWAERTKGRAINELWLARQLRPYGIRSRSIRTAEGVSRGYYLEELMDVFRRYISRNDLKALLAEVAEGEAGLESVPGIWR